MVIQALLINLLNRSLNRLLDGSTWCSMHGSVPYSQGHSMSAHRPQPNAIHEVIPRSTWIARGIACWMCAFELPFGSLPESPVGSQQVVQHGVQCMDQYPNQRVIQGLLHDSDPNAIHQAISQCFGMTYGFTCWMVHPCSEYNFSFHHQLPGALKNKLFSQILFGKEFSK